MEPTNKQLTKFREHAGCARYAYNFAIEIQERVYAEIGYSPSYIDIQKMFVRMEKSEHEWLYDVSKCCTAQAIRDHSDALKRFHQIQKKSNYGEKKTITVKGQKVQVLKGLPNKKKKGKSKDSFYLEHNGCEDFFKTSKCRINLPNIGWIKLSENLPQGIEIKNCVISRQADDWFISFKVKFAPTQHKNHGRVGVDWGIKNLATCSNGVVFESPKKYKTLDKKLKRQQRKQARQYEAWKKKYKDSKPTDKKPMSKNFVKQGREIAKTHKRIVDQRKDSLHKITTYLTQNFTTVVIEDLNVKGMMSNHNLARSIANGSPYEMRRQLEYKGKMYGCEIIIADRFFPSSKMCHNCGHVNKNLKLSDREWDCEECLHHVIRDDNASLNLRDYPIGGYSASSAVKACGARSSAHVAHSLAEKQENNTDLRK